MSLTKQISKTRLFTVIDDMESGLAARTDVVKPTEISPPGELFITNRLNTMMARLPMLKRRPVFLISISIMAARSV